jgi:anti-sigma-K factor RskA
VIQSSNDRENLIAGYVLGDLTTEEVAELDRLLTLQPELLSDVDRFQEVLSMLPLALPEDYPQSDLKAQILENAFLLSSSLSNLSNLKPDSVQKISPKTNLFPYIWGGIIAVILAVIGFDSYTTRQQLAIAQKELSSYQNAIAILKQPASRLLSLKSTTTASGSLVIATQSQSGALTIQNLATPPQDMYYCLWALVDGKKSYIAEFMPDPNGTVMLQFPINPILINTKSVAITLEQKKVTPESGGKMVMQGESSL